MKYVAKLSSISRFLNSTLLTPHSAFCVIVAIAIQISAKGSDLPYISGGDLFSLAIKSDGTIAAWGYNRSGQLGNGEEWGGTYEGIPVPVQVIGLSRVISVAGGNSHSVALRNDGTVWAWGNNYLGQLGEGAGYLGTNQPVQVIGLSGVIAIDTGYSHSLALKSDETLWAWGNNSSGQLGDGNGGFSTCSAVPVQVIGLYGVIAFDASAHCLAAKSDGTLWAWGNNDCFQLGDGTTTDRTTPVQVSGISGAVAVAAGYRHSLAVKSDGTVWAWGWNGYGQLGNGHPTDYYDTNYFSTVPVQAIGLSNVIEVAANCNHSLAVKSDGTVYAWGHNVSGQLGDGTTIMRTTPVQVSGLSGVIAIDTGVSHSLAIKNDGTVWTWGFNDFGQLGDGTTTTRTTPVQVSGLSAPTCETDDFGGAGYEPVKGDFDGDGKADQAVYDESSGSWYVSLSSTRETTFQTLGGAGYAPVSGDFDGDGKTDLVVYDESTGYWYMLLSGSGYTLSYLKFGASGYTPEPGDYDGDEKTDVAVYHELTGYWYMLLSGSGYSLAYMKFGEPGYKSVHGDYDGDGKTDVAVYHESSTYWYILNSSTWSLSYTQFGSSGCEPVVGDYDGDTKTDLAVYDEATAYWYILLSSSGSLSSQKFGEPGYTPVPGDYDGDGKTDIAAYDESTGYWYIQPSSNY